MSNDPETLNIIKDINSSFPYNRSVKQWKEQGKKVIGWICNYVPEEIIHAAGMLPIRVTGEQDAHSIDDATVILSSSICSFSRSCLQAMLDHKLDFLDGFIGGNFCDATRRLSELCLLYHFAAPYTAMINPPARITDQACELYRKELLGLKRSLETAFSIQISNQALRESIKVHNTTRRLLSRLHEMRRSDAPSLSGSEIMEVMNACFAAPKEEFNLLLTRLLEEIGSKNREVTGDHRLMVVGSPLTNPAFFRMVEELGGLIVTEETCTGIRYYWELVNEDPNLSPWDALARRYLTNFPCARMIPSSHRIDEVLELLRDWRVQGVISTVIRWCMFYVCDIPMLRDKLAEAGYPVLELDLEYNEGVTERLRTRVQAFLEMLQGQEVTTK